MRVKALTTRAQSFSTSLKADLHQDITIDFAFSIGVLLNGKFPSGN